MKFNHLEYFKKYRHHTPQKAVAHVQYRGFGKPAVSDLPRVRWVCRQSGNTGQGMAGADLRAFGIVDVAGGRGTAQR